MSAPTLLVVGIVGGFGALARFALDGALSARIASAFPFGTFAVNILGAFALGILVGAAVSEGAMRIAATAGLGAFTTFSTWMFESQREAEEGRSAVAAANIAFSLAAGLLAVWLGRRLGTEL